jgi:hypothetical protein
VTVPPNGKQFPEGRPGCIRSAKCRLPASSLPDMNDGAGCQSAFGRASGPFPARGFVARWVIDMPSFLKTRCKPGRLAIVCASHRGGATGSLQASRNVCSIRLSMAIGRQGVRPIQPGGGYMAVTTKESAEGEPRRSSQEIRSPRCGDAGAGRGRRLQSLQRRRLRCSRRRHCRQQRGDSFRGGHRPAGGRTDQHADRVAQVRCRACRFPAALLGSRTCRTSGRAQHHQLRSGTRAAHLARPEHGRAVVAGCRCRLPVRADRGEPLSEVLSRC